MSKIMNNALTTPRGAVHTYSFSRPYWEATRHKRLLLQYCPASKQFQFFPRPISIATGLQNLEWKEVDGKGEIYSLSMTHKGLGSFEGHEPYLVILVRLDVGIDIVSNLVNCAEQDARIGLRVQPYWHPLDDGRHLLLFEPDLAHA
jgi:uncharacterized OB-fold protein